MGRANILSAWSVWDQKGPWKRLPSETEMLLGQGTYTEVGFSGRVSQRRGLKDENAPTTDGSWGRAVWTGATARAKTWRWNNTEAGEVRRGLRAS